ncbi:MAG TPA: LytR C-terminal domain-containing protein [Longimicrobiales bacterium]|nr:LytR C-terminal domain-containing protein [Longimicrobiales bacterium]
MSPRVRALSFALVGFAILALGAAAIEALAIFGGALPEEALPEPSESAVVAVENVPRTRIRVQVLNGAGRAGLARLATDHLRAAGFDVVYFGNASSFGRDTTVVIDRVGDESVARAVAAAMGVPVQLRSEPDPTLHLEVTVIVGEDWPPDAATRAADELPVARLWHRLFGR